MSGSWTLTATGVPSASAAACTCASEAAASGSASKRAKRGVEVAARARRRSFEDGVERRRRDAILQAGEGGDVGVGQQVHAAGGELAELEHAAAQLDAERVEALGAALVQGRQGSSAVGVAEQVGGRGMPAIGGDERSSSPATRAKRGRAADRERDSSVARA